jgi:hypothetical protein
MVDPWDGDPDVQQAGNLLFFVPFSFPLADRDQ